MSALYDENPLVVNPTIAVAIGLNEAIVLQQMNYWLKRSNHAHDGKTWIYNSIPEWKRQFPFWSESTVKRTLATLEKDGLIISGQFNKDRRDKTKWYRIDHAKVDQKTREIPSGQSDLSIGSDCTDGEGQSDPISSGQSDPTITRDYAETTAETNNNASRKSADVDLPAWLPPETWGDFIEHRKQIKAPMTSQAKTRLLNKLEQCRKDGDDPAQMLNESIINGWKGVFGSKDRKGGAGKKGAKFQNVSATNAGWDTDETGAPRL